MPDGSPRKTILTQDNFAQGKAGVDRVLRLLENLASDATAASLECCGRDMLDARDDFAALAAEFRAAQAHMLRARSMAGRIEIPQVITRDGGT